MRHRPYPRMVKAHALNFTRMQMDTTAVVIKLPSQCALVPQV
jgi:hypothetical protein